MVKRAVRVLMYLTIVAAILSGCAKKEESETETPEIETAVSKDMETTNETEKLDAASATYAIITKEADNTYNEIEALSFKEVIDAAGGTCIIKHPESNKAKDQIAIINELMDQNVNAIAIAGNDYDDLQPALSAALDAGIKVSSLESNVNADSRMTFVNYANAKSVGETLMEAVHDISGGEGQWAILSNNSKSETQNAWIEVMKEVMYGDKYENLELVEVVYGDDEYVDSVEQARSLLQNYPDLKVICGMTTTGTMAAAKVVQDQGVSGMIKVTGLGIPSEMAEYIGDDDDYSCPYMYLWNPSEIGRLSGYVSMALVEGSITGTSGETFIAGDMGEYTIEQAEDGGTEVVIRNLFKFDSSNIEEWKSVF